MVQNPRRSLFIALAAIVVALGVLIGLAFSSPVQTWAARRWLAGQPDMQGELGRVSVGLGHVTVDALRLRTTAGELRAPRIEIELGLIDAARGNVAISRLVAHDWVFDPGASLEVAAISAARPAAATAGLVIPRILAAAGSETAAEAEVAPFTGVLAMLELPVDLALDGVDLAGRVVLPSDGGGVAGGDAQVTLTGGGLRAAETGRFSLDVAVKLADPTAPVQSLDLRGELGAQMSTTRAFEMVSLNLEMNARGPQFPQGTSITARVTAREEEAGEGYDVSVDTETKSLVKSVASYQPADKSLSGTWAVEVADDDVAPFALGLALPEFAATGGGTFSVKDEGETGSVAGTLQVKADRLGAVEPALTAWGAIEMNADFALERRGDVVRITRLKSQVTGVAPVAEVEVLQTFDLNLATTVFAVADSSRDLLRLTLQGVPLGWIQPWLGDTVVSGAPVSGQWTARVFDGGFALKGAAPLRIEGVEVSQAGQTLLRNLNVSALVSAVYSARGWQAEIESLGVRDGNAVLVTLEAKAGQASGAGEPVVAVGKYGVNLAVAAGQPAADGLLAIKRGELAGEFSARLGEVAEFKLKGAVANLVTADDQVMPRVEFDGRADMESDGRVRLDLPVVVTQGERASDLAVRGAVMLGDAVQLDLAVTGERVFPEDLQILAAPFAVAPETDTPTPGPEGDAPPWAGISGTVSLALKEVNYLDQVKLRNVEGRLVITDAEVKLEGFKTGLETGGTIGFSGALKTEGEAAARTYALEAKLKGSEIASGPLMRAFAPDKPPTVEGVFAIDGQVTGTAPTLPGLADTAVGEFSFSSKGGVLRALGFQVGQAAQVGSSVVGLVAGLIGGQKAQNVAEIARAAGALSATLSEIQFDQFNGKVSRSSNLDYRLSDLAMISPTLRLQGAGGITYQPGVSVWRQPLLVELSLSARDATAENLKKLKLLRSETDSLGYSPITKPIKLDGSLIDVGTSELQSLVTKALTQL